MRMLLWMAPLALLACPGDKGTSEEGFTTFELGTFTTDTGGSVDIPLEVPEGAASALLHCGPYTYDIIATAETIHDPTGAQVYTFEEPGTGPVRVLNHDDRLPVLLPVSPDLPVSAGTWTIRAYVDNPEPVTVNCSALLRTAEPAASQTVDLELVFVGVDGEVAGLNAAEADTHKLLGEALNRVGELWAGAGFTLGEVRYVDFAGDVATYNSVDGDAEFGELLRTVEASGSREITIFLVSAITDDDGANILGLAGGPPGVPIVGGTSKSGVVATVGSLVDGDADEMARILAHEGMHFMGLFHTTEKDGSLHDPLGDTAECTADGDGDGTLSAAECTGSGAENLMWWSASASSTGVSADQAWVVQRSTVPW